MWRKLVCLLGKIRFQTVSFISLPLSYFRQRNGKCTLEFQFFVVSESM